MPAMARVCFTDSRIFFTTSRRLPRAAFTALVRVR